MYFARNRRAVGQNSFPDPPHVVEKIRSSLGALGALGAAAFLAGLALGISMVAAFLTGDLAAGAGLLATGAGAGAEAEAAALAGAAALPGCFMKVLKTVLGKR